MAAGGNFGHRLVYGAYRAFEFGLKLVPLPVCFMLGKGLGIAAYLLLPPYRRLAQRNLGIAFEGEKSPAEIRSLARRHFAALGANLFSSIKLTTMSEAAIDRRVTLVGGEQIRALNREGKPFIYLIAHLGAWEVLAQAGQICPEAIRATLYQPLSNPYLDAHVLRRRERTGLKAFGRKDGFNAPMAHLREGGGLGILVDQHAGDGGAWCPFFGRLASTSNLAALMSARTGAAMFPMSVTTVGLARWKMEVGNPVEVEDGESVEVATAKVNQKVEGMIRESPPDWFWVHNRWKIPKPKFLLTTYKRGVVLPPETELKDLKRFRILLRSPNPLGDACMAVPAVRAIKRGRPDAELAVLCPEKLAGFWSLVEDVDRVIPRPRSASNSAIGRKLREAGPFEVAILLPNSPRSALEARKAGIPRIVGYPARLRDRLVHQLVPDRNKGEGPRPHHSNHYLALARHIGADTDDPTLFDPPASRREPDPRLVGIAAGAEYGPAKCYPAARYASAARQIADRRGSPTRFVLFGTPGERVIGEKLAADLGDLADNRIGETDLDGLIEELGRCAALITNDTGTMHLAAFLGVPTVAIFGSTEPAWTGPLGEGHHVLRHHVSCSPCFLRECPIDFRCMTEIAPQEVAEAALEVLGGAL